MNYFFKQISTVVPHNPVGILWGWVRHCYALWC